MQFFLKNKSLSDKQPFLIG